MSLQPIVEVANDASRFKTEQGALFNDLYRQLQAETGTLVPPRKAFSPARARALLSHLFIQEVIDPETVILRLIGTAIVVRTGADATGRNLYELMSPEMKAQSWQHLMQLTGTPCGSRMLCTESYASNSIVTEMVSFPFSDDAGRARFVVATTAQVDLQELMLRGKFEMKFGEVLESEYLDIGGGIGNSVSALN